MLIKCAYCGKQIGEYDTDSTDGFLRPVGHREVVEGNPAWNNTTYVKEVWRDDLRAHIDISENGGAFYGSPTSFYIPFCNVFCRAKWMKDEGLEKHVKESISFVNYAAPLDRQRY